MPPAVAAFERTGDPDRPGGQVLLRDGVPVALVWWAHDYGDRAATGWFMQALDADGEPLGDAPRRLPDAGDVRVLVDDRTLGQAEWVARAETLELVSAPAALAAAERALADELDR
jgi:hypothetical protein